MSSNFYFIKWKNVLNSLEALLRTDLNYQKKAHDKQLCEAVLRLSSVLARYSALYNEASECLHNNLQVQKKKYMQEVIKTVENRQTISLMRRRAYSRRIWERELSGTLKSAPYTLREKSANLIQIVLRYEQIKFFHELPTDKEGGLASIIKEELPSPAQWLEEYNRYMHEKASNKTKTALQIKWEKKKEKQELKTKKKEKSIQNKIEAELKRKMMKNPSLHPGFRYPPSRTTELILKALEHYRKDWDYLDELDTLDVKERFIERFNIEDSWMKAKMEVLVNVQEDMRNEYKKLKAALIEDYTRNNEKIPEAIKKVSKPKFKLRKFAKVSNNNTSELIENLVNRGILIEYPKTKLEDFIGDHNFAGEDLRYTFQQALPCNGDTRSMWWRVCRDVSQGHQKILLVGPNGCGKTKLVYALAKLNNAVLFVLDPMVLKNELTAIHLDNLLDSIKTCALNVQPSAIYIKHLQYIFCKKVPTEEDLGISPKIIKRHIVKKLLRTTNRTHKITIIGGCTEPWTVRSKELLQAFPKALLLPNTCYSVILELLQDWVMRNHEIPNDFDVHSLAHLLESYNFGYLQETLQSYLTPKKTLE
ncbi:dynein regulatory complex protein 11-like [Bombyx mandarina]|uniref:Dynein regulatory complex protein 11-like n=1 Tax=Bombyx mandarina TaxID=7092 RepID=A0A6J2JFK8_BOMMA|nr:dynein regulatory complex protein 11-like [Bombyx mandarina]